MTLRRSKIGGPDEHASSARCSVGFVVRLGYLCRVSLPVTLQITLQITLQKQWERSPTAIVCF